MSSPSPITKGLSLIFLSLRAIATAQGSSSQASMPSVNKIIIFLQFSQSGKSSAEYSKDLAIGVVPLGSKDSNFIDYMEDDFALAAANGTSSLVSEQSCLPGAILV